MNGTYRLGITRLGAPKEEYHQMQELIENAVGVRCSIIISKEEVSIKTQDYADYVLAKSVIRGGVSKKIVRCL